MTQCYNCLWDYEDGTPGYTVELGDKQQWVCLECSKCVVCGAQTGQTVSIPLSNANLIPTVIFFCPQHKDGRDKLVQMQVSSWPSPVLRACYTYITGQTSRVVSSGSQARHRRVEQLNRLRAKVKQDMAVQQRDKAPAHLSPPP